MSKFTSAEKETVKSVIARLSVKRIPEREILKEVFEITGKTITRRTLYHIKNKIKKESFYWYQNLQQNRYEYIYQFKERIREIEDLMKRHNEIIDNNSSPTVKQKSLEELHRLNITLSNYYDVAPQIVNSIAYPKQNNNFTENNDSISIPSKNKEIIV